MFSGGVPASFCPTPEYPRCTRGRVPPTPPCLQCLMTSAAGGHQKHRRTGRRRAADVRMKNKRGGGMLQVRENAAKMRPRKARAMGISRIEYVGKHHTWYCATFKACEHATKPSKARARNERTRGGSYELFNAIGPPLKTPRM